MLAGKKVLIVDDDVRNIFALTSVLERYRMQVVYADNGKKGLEILQAAPDVFAVLMDIMMPCRTWTAARRCAAIRRIERFKDLPIVALDGQGDEGDREKCIEAGATSITSRNR